MGGSGFYISALFPPKTDFRMTHLITSLGTISNAFPKSTKTRYNIFFLARCFSIICRRMSNDEIGGSSSWHKTKLHLIELHLRSYSYLQCTILKG